MIAIDADKAIQLLREVVSGNEDFVYAQPGNRGITGVTCFYQRDGMPSCLIGQALHRAGVSVASLAGMDRCEPDTDIVNVDLPAGLTLTDDAREIFTVAQHYQDLGIAWGIALREAEVMYRTYSDD